MRRASSRARPPTTHTIDPWWARATTPRAQHRPLPSPTSLFGLARFRLGLTRECTQAIRKCQSLCRTPPASRRADVTQTLDPGLRRDLVRSEEHTSELQ